MNRRHKTVTKQIKKGRLQLPKKSLPKTIEPEMITDAQDNLKSRDDKMMTVTLKGSKWVYIENYSYIADYNDKMIKITGKEQMLVIEGRRLSLIYFTEDDLLLGGRILTVKYI